MGYVVGEMSYGKKLDSQTNFRYHLELAGFLDSLATEDLEVPMQYRLDIVSCSNHSIVSNADGNYQFRLISDAPFKVVYGKLLIEGLRFKNSFNRYGLEHGKCCSKIYSLDWHVLKYLQENGSSSFLNINAYLESVKDKIPKTKLPLTPDGEKGIRKRCNAILEILGCRAYLHIRRGILELHVQDEGG